MNDRHEGFRLTEEWVNEVRKKRLTERDLRILDILKKHKLVDRDQLLNLVMAKGKQATQVINKRLKFLYDHHFVDRAYAHIIPGRGASPYIYSLDRACSYIYGIKPWRKIIRHIKGPTGDIIKKLPISYIHNIIINDVVCACMEVSFSQNWHIVYYGVEEDNYIPLNFKNKNAIVPDIILIIKNELGDARVFFIEVDLGNEGKDILKAKIDHYNALKVYRTWISEGWYKEFIANESRLIFPHILFAMGNSNPSRNKMVRDHMHGRSLDGTVIPLSGFSSWLATIFD